MSEGIYNAVSRTDLTTQACDMCRKRKVKCQLPRQSAQALSRCQRCERLNLMCTFVSPSKARGPKKRYATIAITEREKELTRTRLATRAEPQKPYSPDVQYRSDDLCSRDLFKIIMQDYLEYLYPMVPIVHRSSFREALLEDQDREDEDFCAVTLAIAALVVATLASRFPIYKSHAQPLRFASRREFVHFCYKKVLALRSSSYFDQLNFQKLSVPYLFHVAFLQLGDHNWARMVSVEALQMARLLNLHRISEYEGLNCIEAQLRKKGFWLVFYCYV